MNNDEKDLPQHIAIIMDGNGRWAKQKGFGRTKGHERGAEVVRDITTYCSNNDIKYLTLYAFSTENWRRPKTEVLFLTNLFNRYFKKELDVYLEHNVKFKAIGDISKFPDFLQKTIKKVEEKTSACTGTTQILALNYGSRDEIIRAINRLQEQKLEVNEENFQKCLDTAKAPDVDLLIRTSGEVRLSNYLLWQSAYAEMFFTKTLWPDFTTKEFGNIIKSYTSRERRFGGI